MSSRNVRFFITFLILAGISLSCASCGPHELSRDEIERNRLYAEILKRSDRREVGGDGFFAEKLLYSPFPQVRQWCAIALGRIGDRRALPMLLQSLDSPYAEVRAAGAFAIGEIEDREMRQKVFREANSETPGRLIRLLDDPSPAVQMRAIEALGKLGDRAHAGAIVGRLKYFHDDRSPLSQAYLSLAITALMRLNAGEALPVFTRLAREGDPEIQWRVANALFRMRAREALPVFLELLNGTDTDVQAHAARGLGICEDPSLARYLTPLIGTGDPEAGHHRALKVRVYALQALGTLKNPDSVPVIVESLRAARLDDAHPEDLNYAIQAANALGGIGASAAEAGLAQLLAKPGPVADAAIVALAKVLKNDPDRFFSHADGNQFSAPASKRAWAAALGELSGTRAIAELRQMLIRAAGSETDSADWLAVPSVLVALGKTRDPGLREILKPYLASHDGVILRAAVQTYLDFEGAGAKPDPIMSAFSAIASGTDVEAKTYLLDSLAPWCADERVRSLARNALSDRQRNVRIEAAGLLRRAGEGEVPSDPGPSDSSASDNDYALLAGMRQDRTVAVLETARGTIEIELFREDAPITVANFALLARRGFFNGLTFMRVVPYFVIQAGDPRNDQEGGPGYTIRCEINTHPFERGSLGMALSGKDTGGSQFFITMAPQPHLDGGYTCFGRVISGMQAADRMVSGDKIIKVSVMEDRAALDARNY